jgi:hypothetical protein
MEEDYSKKKSVGSSVGIMCPNEARTTAHINDGIATIHANVRCVWIQMHQSEQYQQPAFIAINAKPSLKSNEFRRGYSCLSYVRQVTTGKVDTPWYQ